MSGTDLPTPRSRWRTCGVAALVLVGLLLAALVGMQVYFGGGGAAAGTDVTRVAFLDAQGARQTLAHYRGKVVLVDVWATWCGPCRMALPEVAELQKAGGDRYAVLPISVDKGGWDDVKPFLAKNPQLGLTAFVPDGATGLAPLGTIRGIPVTVVIDREGRVVKRWAGYREGMAKQALEEALKGR